MPRVSLQLPRFHFSDLFLKNGTLDMKQEKLRQHSSSGTPDLSKLRPGLFWDTDIKQGVGFGMRKDQERGKCYEINDACNNKTSL